MDVPLIESAAASTPRGFGLESLEGGLCVSAITVAGLYSGVRDNDEEAALERFLSAFDVIPIDEALARLGGLRRRSFRPRSTAAAWQMRSWRSRRRPQERCW